MVLSWTEDRAAIDRRLGVGQTGYVGQVIAQVDHFLGNFGGKRASCHWPRQRRRISMRVGNLWNAAAFVEMVGAGAERASFALFRVDQAARVL